jgi:Methyltransferase domain
VAEVVWMEGLHATDPYENFPIASYQPDMEGWGSDNPIFEAVISQLRPPRVIEVGTWKGASAIHMAGLMRKHNAPGKILCVDTWLGSGAAWLELVGSKSMPMKHGRPALYEQFLANVIHSGNTKTIIPFPVDSISAAHFVAAKKQEADAIYIDASHDYQHVTNDLEAWWPVLRSGGVMFGDDYDLHWIGVVRAVHDFADRIGVTVYTQFRNKWFIQKPN